MKRASDVTVKHPDGTVEVHSAYSASELTAIRKNTQARAVRRAVRARKERRRTGPEATSDN